MLPMHVWHSDGQNPQICTTFPVIKCVFLSLRVKCVLCHFLVHRFSLPRYTFMWAWHVPVYAKAQCCFKSFALRSCQCGRKTRYGLEFWSLDLLSARVNFLGRVPALVLPPRSSDLAHYCAGFMPCFSASRNVLDCCLGKGILPGIYSQDLSCLSFGKAV